MKNPARKKIRPMLSPFVDGELSPRERMLVERHLASCKESADEAADMRALSKLLRAGMEEAAEQEDWSAFSDQLLSRVLPEKLPFFQRLRIQLSEVFTYQRHWVLAGASAMALACLGVFMWTSPAEPVGYGSPHLSIKTVSAKGSSALKTIVTHTETGDAVVWLIEEASEEAEKAAPQEEEAPSNTFQEFPNKDVPNNAGAL
jgi:hypothetical protein